MLTVNERVQDHDEMYRRMTENSVYDLRVAAPGIIQSFDPATQTATVQLAIREKINIDGNVSDEEIPVLPDIPVFMPRAGGYCLTMPISAGDECLVIFGDSCMDAWWQSGGVQNQVEKRRHDLSDGYALVGIWSQPRVISGYSASSAQLRTDDGGTVIDLRPGLITHTATQVVINSTQVTIAGKDFLAHHHSDPQGGTTGGVT